MVVNIKSSLKRVEGSGPGQRVGLEKTRSRSVSYTEEEKGAGVNSSSRDLAEGSSDLNLDDSVQLKPESSGTSGNRSQDDKIVSDGTKEFRNAITQGVGNIFQGLRSNLVTMEVEVKLSNLRLVADNDVAFLLKQNERTIASMRRRHERELSRLRAAFESAMEATRSRKRAILQQRNLNTAAENNDQIILEQESAQSSSAELKAQLDDYRDAFEELLREISKRHTRTRKQLSVIQDRRIQDRRTLMELEVATMTEEKRTNHIKTFQFQINLQKARDKKRGDHLRAAQALEIRQAKERFELEIRSLEELEMHKVAHSQRLQALARRQRTEVQQAEARIIELQVNQKAAEQANAAFRQYNKMRARHRVEHRLMLELQREHVEKIRRRWGEQLALFRNSTKNTDTDCPLMHEPHDFDVCTLAFRLSNAKEEIEATDVGLPSSAAVNAPDDDEVSGMGDDRGAGSATSKNSYAMAGSGSSGAAVSHASSGSADSVASSSLPKSGLLGGVSNGADAGAASQSFGADVFSVAGGDANMLRDEINRAEHDLKLLTMEHARQMTTLQRKLNREYSVYEQETKDKLNGLMAEHRREIEAHESQQKNEFEALRSTQDKETRMEESILKTEHNMHIERKRLNLMFQTVIDGIITIDVRGVIHKINNAAEKMFGYAPGEVIGQNVKVLQPPEVARNHDEYMNRYLTTGVTKIIGIGSAAHGLRKDGSVFPLHLSVSEVKMDGVHIFTAVIRDRTQEVAMQEKIEGEQRKKIDMMQSLIEELAKERGRCDDLINAMLPKTIAKRMLQGETVLPERFAEATVLFTEICGFAELSTTYSAMDIVELLNDLYCVFDEVVLNYDVYKVETIADSYVCVSGVPQRNTNHAGEIAKLAMHFQKAIKLVRMRNYPEFELKLKVGIHTGPLVAGIVGCKNPRYCLFGDTVNTASRMKSTSEPKRIHISGSAHKALAAVDNSPFRMVCRGEVPVKGKGNMLTYYLEDIDGFNCDLAAIKRMNILKRNGSEPLGSQDL